MLAQLFQQIVAIHPGLEPQQHASRRGPAEKAAHAADRSGWHRSRGSLPPICHRTIRRVDRRARRPDRLLSLSRRADGRALLRPMTIRTRGRQAARDRPKARAVLGAAQFDVEDGVTAPPSTAMNSRCCRPAVLRDFDLAYDRSVKLRSHGRASHGRFTFNSGQIDECRHGR